MRQASRGRRISITWKITGTLVAVILLFGCSAIATVYQLVGRALHEEIDLRGVAIGTSLSDGVAGAVTTKDALLLHATVTKYALLDGVAYASLEDRNGKVLAHSLASFAEELKSSTVYDGQDVAEIQKRQLTLRGRPIYETVVPILGGRMGAVHVGFWADEIEEQIKRVLIPIVALIAALLIISLIVGAVLSRQILRPIRQLTSAADAMTKGDLDMQVAINRRDEIGELAMSLERMRASLKAAMLRLTRATEGRSGTNGVSGTGEKFESTSL
jgi:methyl-accepting chemotaxis protein